MCQISYRKFRKTKISPTSPRGAQRSKWSKGKQKEKVNNMVLFDQASYDKLISEAPKCKLITPSVISDRLRGYISGRVGRVRVTRQKMSQYIETLNRKKKSKIPLKSEHPATPKLFHCNTPHD
ncbi:hypothetical protein MKX01_014430 [Papaver californicum]|nr:hypothetical protein MKX01_014430 [Papaver californicum]